VPAANSSLSCFLFVLYISTFAAHAATTFNATFNQYCTSCHNSETRTAGLTLEDVTPSQTTILEKALLKIRAGEMPPAGLPAPSKAERQSIVAALETHLDRISAQANPPAPGVHRLNRAEYRNAVRDLLALDLDHSAALPPDDSSFGFDNVAAVLTVSPLHMEKYLASARRIARLATGTLKPSLSSEKISTPPGTSADLLDSLPPSERGAAEFHRFFPFDATYSFLIRIRGNPSPGLPPARLDFRIDGKRAKLFDTEIDTAEANQGTRLYELRLPVTAGAHRFSAAFLTESARIEALPRPQFNAPAPTTNNLSVESITLAGPFDAKGPGNTPSRQRIFLCRPANAADEDPCARRILTNLAHLAYRRPITPADLTPLITLFRQGRADARSFDSGIELALTGLLVAPSFLFRPEGHTTLDLASRLSFFLWSSIPDQALLRDAESGRLTQPTVLRAHVRRLLADPKSRAIADNFAGQWLHLRNVAGWSPDPERFRQFDESLRNAFQRESELFFTHIVQNNRSVLDFLDAPYTFLNERLARHYGINGIKGSYFRQVSLPANHRGGLLGQGSILMVTSYPTRTSPVLRGKWILENLLGTPPPPPPPNVPPLDDSASSSAQSLRQQMQKHRANPACASCHAKLDPLGFTLEEFDAVGQHREADSTGNLPDGTAINGFNGLKQVMLARKDEFVECLAAKLLTYALGRGLEPADQPTIRQIRRQAAANNYQFASLVDALVRSPAFHPHTARQSVRQ
jgi:mono/diheme cytochrome c family protein